MKMTQVRICGVQTEIPESGYDWIVALSQCHPHSVTDRGILHCHRYGEARHEWWCMCSSCISVREVYRLNDVHRRDLGLPVGYPPRG